VTPLYARYQPTNWDEVVGQDEGLARLENLRSRGGLSGRAYWLSGPSGTGKSTIARLIADEIADPIKIDEIDASTLLVPHVQEIERRSHCFGIGAKSGRAYLVNEAHGLRKDTVRQLLVTLERIPPHVVWAFTTTNEGQDFLFDGMADAHPLLSRCHVIPMAKQGLVEAMAVRAREIAVAEGLDGRPAADYLQLVYRHKSNLRSVLNAIEAGEMLAPPAQRRPAEVAECVGELLGRGPEAILTKAEGGAG
jgi:replication-associated recombination protein RarA